MILTKKAFIVAGVLSAGILAFQLKPKKWESKFVQQDKNGALKYIPDEKGNIIPDFSRVGYQSGDQPIPEISVIKTISPAANGSSQEIIQSAIDEVSKRTPDQNGFRGAILLKKGTYEIPDHIRIEASGIVLRGESDDKNGTKLVATSEKQVSMISVSGKGEITEVKGTRTKLTDTYVPVGTFSFNVASATGFAKGDRIILYRPGTDQWIKDLKMDQIVGREGTKQWQAKEYNLQYERIITKIEGNKIFIDNPVVMALEEKYGGAEIYKYSFSGRISNVGIENIYCESAYKTDTSENHAWDAVAFAKVEHGWVKNVTARYFGYSCVNLASSAKNISVLNSNCYDHKSVITGGRRYSFNNNGQLNLFMNCKSTDGRHDYVTGARTCGPNVFYNCTASKTHADIGPHHRWASGTLYDNIITDGAINVHDRGNYGSGHGWVGVTQVLWNCTAEKVAVQNPWSLGSNYCIGLKGKKDGGRFKDRPDGIWEGLNREGLEPVSLYTAQLEARKKK
jgi:hypothetical protein